MKESEHSDSSSVSLSVLSYLGVMSSSSIMLKRTVSQKWSVCKFLDLCVTLGNQDWKLPSNVSTQQFLPSLQNWIAKGANTSCMRGGVVQKDCQYILTVCLILPVKQSAFLNLCPFPKEFFFLWHIFWQHLEDKTSTKKELNKFAGNLYWGTSRVNKSSAGSVELSEPTHSSNMWIKWPLATDGITRRLHKESCTWTHCGPTLSVWLHQRLSISLLPHPDIPCIANCGTHTHAHALRSTV